MRSNRYESRRYLEEYLLFHYGSSANLCPFAGVPRGWLRFHEQLRTKCLGPMRSRGPIRALDIGCGVGRFTFELARIADEVLGVDYSRKFIEAARKLARTNSITLRIRESGASMRSHRVSLPAPLRNKCVRFQVGDALDVRCFSDQPFQIVAAINLLCRLPSPRKFLSSLARIVTPRGQLLLASPYSWSQEYTPPSEWLSSKQVADLLRPDFKLSHRGDFPFIIREHRRKYQLVFSEVMTFVRT